jgi:hypothetical protein
MLTSTENQINLITEFFNSNGIKNVQLSGEKPIVKNGLSIELRNKHQAVTLLSRIVQLRPGLILDSEDIFFTFNEKKHRFLTLT